MLYFNDMVLIINAVDASLVFAYYANLAETPDLTLEVFLEERGK